MAQDDSDASRNSVRGPGLARGRKGPPLALVGARVRTSDAAWREAFTGADALSEGAVRTEPEGRVWYGTTSLILALDPRETAPFDAAGLAERDVHARLRAVRIARREAQCRAPATLGPVKCELRFSPHRRGLRVDVEVEASLIEAPLRRGREHTR